MGFQRALASERTLVLINYGQESREVAVPGLSGSAGAELLWASEPRMAGRLHSSAPAPALRSGGHALPAQSVQVWRLSAAVR